MIALSLGLSIKIFPNNMKKIIIANWKMKLDYKSSLALAKQVLASVKKSQKIKSEVVICPDYLSITPLAKIFHSSPVKLGAQDSAMTDRGAFTGEVSAADLSALGVKYVIVGHSERREHLHENSSIINAKIKTSLTYNLTPIVCVGEKLMEKKSGEARKYLSKELNRALRGVKIKSAADLIIAYEPIWAISSSSSARAMSAMEAEEIQKFLKGRAARILHKNLRVIYGGSVNSKNAGEFLQQKNIDGLLVGAASINNTEFMSICSQ